MEKTYRQVPFDVELAKKIQSGEIEGKIMCNGEEAEIIDFGFCLDYSDRENTHFIAALVMSNSKTTRLDLFRKDGVNRRGSEFINLYIELPEEEPKHDSFNKKLHDTAEVLATPKYEFKVGDIVKVVKGNKEVGCVGSLYAPMYSGQGHIIGWLVIVEKERLNGILVENLEPASEKEIEIYKNTKVEPKHEFKPFDRVLVREDESDVWECRLFDRFFQDKGGLGYCCQDGVSYDFCIPYEGNQELVGTRNEPKCK